MIVSMNRRQEVMQSLETAVGELVVKYLKPVEEYWQSSDLLPDARNENFFDEVKEIQSLAKEMSYEMLVVLIGDTVTEEALPTYESWLLKMEGIDCDTKSNWVNWVRGWTAEENRHGDLLHKYLYLCGRVDMKEFEITTHHLINDGFDIGTSNDPYRNFIYTSFQEQATNISHRRVGALAKEIGDQRLTKICSIISGDELRHAKAYREFVKKLFEVDPSEVMIAFEDMMKKKILMPAHFLRESGGDKGALFSHFSDIAQKINVYTTHDYIEILEGLLKEWELEKVLGLNDKAQKARDYVIALPGRLKRLADRVKIPEVIPPFKWVSC